VPVVQPATGAFPEILEKTGGGIIYSPDTVEELSKNLVKILAEDDLRKKLGDTGSVNVRSELSLDKMAEGLTAVYSKLAT